jgi:hypothetical protein
MLVFGVGDLAGADVDDALSGWGVFHVFLRLGVYESAVFVDFVEYLGVDV